MNHRRKIVSFCLWGDLPQYIDGAIKNAEEYPKVFDGWECRFYTHDVSDATLKELKKRGAEIIPQMDGTTPGIGMYYRFFPMGDDPAKTERFIVRDTDSRPSKREFDAVSDWVESGEPFHVIRDAPVHNIPILGGTWGAVPGIVDHFKERLSSWFSIVQPNPDNPRGPFFGTDQIFLCTVVWPFVRYKHLAHVRAGYESLLFSETDRCLPELEDGGHFVGMPC